MMNKKLGLIILLCVLMLCGCGNTRDKVVYTPQKIEVDNNTVRDKYLWNKVIEIENEDKDSEDYTVEPGGHVSEVILENSDTSQLYSISGSSVVYNGKTYYDLYSIAQSVETPYDLNTFINFIVKTYKTNSDEVYAYLTKDGDELEEDVGASIPVDEALSEFNGYSEICEKYNDKATWIIQLNSNKLREMGWIYGCKSFVLYKGSDDLNIDMSEFYSETPVQTPTEPVESTEDTEAGTEIGTEADTEVGTEPVESTESTESVESTESQGDIHEE